MRSIILVFIISVVILIAAIIIKNTDFYYDYEYKFKDEIFKFVKENHELLEKAPEEIKSLDHSTFYISTTEKRNIKGQLLYYNIEDNPDYNNISGLYSGIVKTDGSKAYTSLKNDVISEVLDLSCVKSIDIVSEPRFFMGFYYGGELTGKMIYYGYYYTEDNLPIGYAGKDVSLTKSGNGWTWKEPVNSDNINTERITDNNIYYTERITDNWFYYKMRW